MSQSHIIAEVRLSADTLSFTKGPDPSLVISLTLVNSQTPISIPKNTQTQLFNATNAIVVRDQTHQKEIPLPTLDLNLKNAPAICLTLDTASRFVTLEPDKHCDIATVPFRPLGSRRKSVEGTAPGLSLRDGFMFAQLGLHLFEPECEYVLQVKGGIRVSCWAEGRVEDLLRQDLPQDCWAPRANGIEVVPGKGFAFRVVD